MRKEFNAQLELLSKELQTMGGMCRKALADAVLAIKTGDETLARSITETAAEVNAKQREVESLCLRLILRQQPVAGDLRDVSAAMKLVVDLKRIADHAAEIGEIVSMGNIEFSGEMLGAIADAAEKILDDSLCAFTKRDAGLAGSAVDYDDVVDECFDDVKKRVIASFSLPDTDGECALDCLMAAKYFERIGDHAVNIAKCAMQVAEA